MAINVLGFPSGATCPQPIDIEPQVIAAASTADNQIAAEVPYSNAASGLAASDVQGAIDLIDACCDASTAANAAQDTTIAALGVLAHAPGSDNQIAATVPYSNAASGLAASDVQGAIDLIDACCDASTAANAAQDAAIATLQGSAHAPGSDNQTAATVPYTPGGVAGQTNIQGAIDALAATVAGLPPDTDDQTAAEVNLAPVIAGLPGAITVQDALAQLATKHYAFVNGSGASQSLPAASFMRKNFTTLVASSAVVWNAGSSAFIVSTPGLYQVSASAIFNPSQDWSANSTSSHTSVPTSIYIFVNGIFRHLLARDEKSESGNSSADYVAVIGSAMIFLNANDSVDVRLYTSASGSHTTLANDSAHSFFGISKL